VQQHILQMGVLNDYIRHLPTLKDSPKAVSMTKKVKVPFGKVDLATIVLGVCPNNMAEPEQPNSLTAKSVLAGEKLVATYSNST
jgi:hypothetical protein